MSRMFGELGVGVGLRAPHVEIFEREVPASVNWIEVISENYMAWKGRALSEAHQTLLQIRRDIPVALHGVSLSIGSADGVDLDYLKRLRQLTDILEPSIVSDHLCWTGVDGVNVHDLLPIPYTQEALNHIAEKIIRVQEILGRRILIENPSSYLEFAASEMSEWEFLIELSEKADCGLLLDINNVYVSSVNHGFDPLTYLEALPKERIGQIHLAGHSRKDGFLIDTHDAPVTADVWNLFANFTQKYGRFSAMIERDGNIPEWSVLEKELLQIGAIYNENRPVASRNSAAVLSGLAGR